jgi:hypothetical protein
MEIADLQALLWYSEKDLYSLFETTSKSSEKLDYVDSARETARGRNVPARLMFMPDGMIPGASSAGGYRILPSGRNFRVYGPGKNLIGVSGSQEEAERLVQRRIR